jgi:hypothetical protein
MIAAPKARSAAADERGQHCNAANGEHDPHADDAHERVHGDQHEPVERQSAAAASAGMVVHVDIEPFRHRARPA